ncbi:hypothetical protein Ae201684P_001403 [Aphanomyces euteiches]|nr:hypothetical protein Ae201684P_001403 [Aphanomyces euteiches]KAH9138955.1 hypothetical protein AeRB84_016751 [Aphanomyces euteiches]
MTTKRRGSTFLDEATAAFTVQASPILSRTVDPSKEYGWTQTEEELYIYVPVRPRIVRKGVNVLATQAADGVRPSRRKSLDMSCVFVDTLVHSRRRYHPTDPRQTCRDG